MKKPYKILVLSDLKTGTENVLKHTISFAKKLKAEIEFLYVKNPIEVIDKESQLSAMRVINEEHFAVNKKIEDLLNPIRNTYGLKIKSNFKIGNVKSEIDEQIKSSKPDVIVLGKRKPNTLSFTGDKITNHILKQFKGAILIAGNQNIIEPEKKLSLGLFKNESEIGDKSFIKELQAHALKPLKTFKIVKNLSEVKATKNLKNAEVEEFLLENNNNTIKSLSKALLNNNVGLLCLNRDLNTKKTLKAITPLVKKVINKLNVSILITNETILVS